MIVKHEEAQRDQRHHAARRQGSDAIPVAAFGAIDLDADVERRKESEQQAGISPGQPDRRIDQDQHKRNDKRAAVAKKQILQGDEHVELDLDQQRPEHAVQHVLAENILDHEKIGEQELEIPVFMSGGEKAEQENQCDIDRVGGKNLEQPPRQEDRGVLPLDVAKYQIAAQEEEEQHATAPERRDVMGELAEDDPVRAGSDRRSPSGSRRRAWYRAREIAALAPRWYSGLDMPSRPSSRVTVVIDLSHGVETRMLQRQENSLSPACGFGRAADFPASSLGCPRHFAQDQFHQG